MGNDVIRLSEPGLPPLPKPQQDATKRWIRIEFDVLTKQETISGHVYDKNLAINLMCEAIKMINNMGTAPIQPLPNNKDGEGHS